MSAARQWHKVIGLTVGILLALVAVSGVVLVFKENIIALSLPAAQSAAGEALAGDSGVAAYDIENLLTGLGQVLQQHSAEEVFYIKTPTQGRRYWWVATMEEDVYLYDGKTGEALEDRFNVLPVLHWLGDFHTHMLVHEGGTVLITLLGIFVLVLIVVGVVSWWPGRKGFRLRHLWSWPSRRGPALRQHRAIAIITLPLLLLSVVTGAGMSVQSAVPFLLRATPAAVQKPVAVPDQAGFVVQWPAIEVKLRDAQKRFPESQITMLSLPKQDKPRLRLRLRGPSEWHVNGKTNVEFDLVSGDMNVQDVRDASMGRKSLNLFYPLHASYGLPGFYKALVTLTGVLTGCLALLGLVAWLRRRGGALR